MRFIKTILVVVALAATLTTTTGCFDKTTNITNENRNDMGIKNPITVYISYSGTAVLYLYANGQTVWSGLVPVTDSITVPDSSYLYARWSTYNCDTIAIDHMTWHIGN
jgi:hypothetical protein